MVHMIAEHARIPQTATRLFAVVFQFRTSREQTRCVYRQNEIKDSPYKRKNYSLNFTKLNLFWIVITLS